MDFDLAVVGAGPTGAAATYWGARAGLSVAMIDKADFPRDKTCGDGLTAAALRELAALGIDVRDAAQTITRTELVGPFGARAELPLDEGLRAGAITAAVMRRVEFDTMLADHAVRAGVKLIPNTTMRAIAAGAESVALHLDGESAPSTLTARWVIGADGAHSGVRRQTYERESRRLPGMQAVRQYVDAPGLDPELLSVYFSPELLPGYGWIFPVPGGGANIGLGVHRDPAVMGRVCAAALTNEKGHVALGGLGDLYRSFLARPDVIERIGTHAAGESRMAAWPIPADPSLAHIGTGRVLLAGDAARLADPMTGEGIGQGLISARLAATHVARAIRGAGVVDAQTGYRNDLERELGRDLRFAAGMLKVMRHRKGIEWGLRLAARNAWTRRNVARWMFEDYPRAQLFTPGRWREHSMSGRGAYGV